MRLQYFHPETGKQDRPNHDPDDPNCRYVCIVSPGSWLMVEFDLVLSIQTIAKTGTLQRPAIEENARINTLRQIDLIGEANVLLIRITTNKEGPTLVIRAEMATRDGHLLLCDDYSFQIAISIHLDSHCPSLEVRRHQPNLQVQFKATERMKRTVFLAPFLLQGRVMERLQLIPLEAFLLPSKLQILKNLRQSNLPAYGCP